MCVLTSSRDVDSERAPGDGGGGIATALGIRPRGVPLEDGRDFVGVTEGILGPLPGVRYARPGFGVFEGEFGIWEEDNELV